MLKHLLTIFMCLDTLYFQSYSDLVRPSRTPQLIA